MKRIPILLLTLIIGASLNAVFSAKTQAFYQDENGATWWSVEELLEFSEVVDAEEEALCGDDYGCREELYFSRFENDDGRYGALDMLRQGRFWITSINPTEETLEVLYFDEDEMLKRWGIEEHQPLDFIFLAWFDNINGQIGNYNHYLPIEPQFSEDLHLLYAESDNYPANRPFQLPIVSTNLIDNTLGRIYLAVFGENFNSKGYMDYSSCLVDYREGETCKLMFSPGRGYSYLSPRETTSENEQNNENEENEPSGTDSTEPEVQTDDGVNDIEDESANSLTTLKTPNTGANTNACNKTVEFPWWLGILLIIGNITALWLFLPQKSQKILKKGLDKN